MAKKTENAQEVIREIEAGKRYPIYFLMGEEPYYIDEISNRLLKLVLTESQQDFDQRILYGKDLSVAQLINEARRYPTLAPYQVILVREAQMIRNFEEEFLLYVQQPMPSTILIINYKYKSLDKRRKLYSALEQSALLFESKKMYDNQIPAWITRFLSEQEIQIEAKAAQMLADFLGTDLGRIVGELEKLKLLLKTKPYKITAAMVELNIGVSKEYNNFELIDAIKQKDQFKAQQIPQYFARNPKNNAMVVTLIVLFDYFSKLLMYHYLPDKSSSNVASQLGIPPFLVKNYQQGAQHYNANKVVRNISLIRHYDARLKGFEQAALPESELLRELLCLLMA